MFTTVQDKPKEIRCPSFSKTMIGKLKASENILELGRNTSIFNRGNSAEYIFFIQSGYVQLFRSSPDKREQSISVLGKGEWMGYRDALSGGLYQHNARTLCKTTIYAFSNCTLNQAMNEDISFANLLVQTMVKGWIESENRVYNLSGRRVFERLAEFLLSLDPDCETTKNETYDRKEFKIPMTRDVLASLLGTTTETVIRTLSDFKARGWIELGRGTVCLRDKRQLAKLAAGS